MQGSKERERDVRIEGTMTDEERAVRVRNYSPWLSAELCRPWLNKQVLVDK